MQLTRRRFLIVGATIGAIAAVVWDRLLGQESEEELAYHIDNWPPLSWRTFADTSPWNALRDHSSVDPNSQRYIDTLGTFRGVDGRGGPEPQTKQKTERWGFPLYWGRARDPLYRIRLRQVIGQAGREIQDRQVHVPPNVKPSAGDDGVFRLMEQVDGFQYHFQQASVDYVNRIINAWRGYRLPMDGSGFHNISEPPTGTLPIRPEELAAGYVNHTVGMHVWSLSGHSVAPYDQSGTKGQNVGGVNPNDCLSMGNVVFLDLSIPEIDALHIPVWQKAILKGLSDHGAVVGWNGSLSWTLTFECPFDRTAYGKPDPYIRLGLTWPLDYRKALDEVGGWGAHLKVLQPFPRS